MGRKYRLKAGSYATGSLDKLVVYKAKGPNNIVESEENLAAEFPEKFELVDMPYEQKPAKFPKKESEEAPVPVPAGLRTEEVYDDELETMTVAELKQLAEEEEVELHGGMRKDEIIESIREARK
jgi:hypothetical protein